MSTVLFGLGWGFAAATGMDIAQEGLDGLNLLLLFISSLLVYKGGKELFSE